MSSFDRARDAVYFVTATIDSLAGVVENAIFSVNLVDGGAPASWIVFTEDITKIADQQGRYAVWHVLSPLGIECGLRYLGAERSLVYLKSRYEIAFHVLDGLQRYSLQPQMVDWMEQIRDER